MLQRVQTLFLTFVFLLSLLLVFLPVYEYAKPTIGQGPSDFISAYKPYMITDNVLLMLLNGSIALLAIVTVFLFRNRNLQIRLTGLSLLLISILTGLLFFLADNLGTALDNQLKYRYGAYLPILQLIFTFLAQRAIRKDEELVRSADRLR